MCCAGETGKNTEEGPQPPEEGETLREERRPRGQFLLLKVLAADPGARPGGCTDRSAKASGVPRPLSFWSPARVQFVHWVVKGVRVIGDAGCDGIHEEKEVQRGKVVLYFPKGGRGLGAKESTGTTRRGQGWEILAGARRL